ncbi:hypothetical protein ATY77_03770 [Rhizobium sp. R634]|nr:hypothetical protein ATY77_03770 [Rhizobium sp. R634]
MHRGAVKAFAAANEPPVFTDHAFDAGFGDVVLRGRAFDRMHDTLIDRPNKPLAWCHRQVLLREALEEVDQALIIGIIDIPVEPANDRRVERLMRAKSPVGGRGAIAEKIGHSLLPELGDLETFMAAVDVFEAIWNAVEHSFRVGCRGHVTKDRAEFRRDVGIQRVQVGVVGRAQDPPMEVLIGRIWPTLHYRRGRPARQIAEFLDTRPLDEGDAMNGASEDLPATPPRASFCSRISKLMILEMRAPRQRQN